MCRYRLAPSPGQETVLRDHCGHARFVWNLAVEQHSRWRPGRTGAPGYLEQSRQLTAARRDNQWLRAGSQMVQQQALRAPRLSPARQRRLEQLQRTLARARPGSNRRARAKRAIARLKARDRDTRKDWAEKASTDLARRFDLIRVEDLKIGSMTRSARGTTTEPGRNVRAKAGLNRELMRSGWGLLVRRLEDKAPGRVEKTNPAFTSQRCSACGHVDPKSRESQAVFRCTACGYAINADVNAARNIAAGHAVTVRRRPPLGGRMNRESQLALLSA
jgi:putative transposase